MAGHRAPPSHRSAAAINIKNGPTTPIGYLRPPILISRQPCHSHNLFLPFRLQALHNRSGNDRALLLNIDSAGSDDSADSDITDSVADDMAHDEDITDPDPQVALLVTAGRTSGQLAGENDIDTDPPKEEKDSKCPFHTYNPPSLPPCIFSTNPPFPPFDAPFLQPPSPISNTPPHQSLPRERHSGGCGGALQL